jgi:hypothetical protein
MRRRVTVAVLVVVCAITTVVVFSPAGNARSEAAPQDQSTEAQPPPPQVVKTWRKHPPRRVTRRYRFTPWAYPTVGQVFFIARYEARKWHVSASHLLSRIHCESTYNWRASNGSYFGLLQFAPGTFSRGMSTIHTRLVKLVRTKHRTRPTWVYSKWSDGRVTRMRGKRMRQRIRYVHQGWIPRRASFWHGWAQVRIGAQAMAGRSAVHDSEWQCR